MTVDLNIDLGELDDEPLALYELATVVNIACGGHAGSPVSMAQSVQLACASGARIAAHPSYPDRCGFGRVSMVIEPSALYESIVDQCLDLRAVASRMGATVDAVKLHGALYHDAAATEQLAACVLDAVVSAFPSPVEIVGSASGHLRAAAAARGLPYCAEAFADRGYAGTDVLVRRGAEGALLHDPAAAAAQALIFARSGRYGTVCVHGDTPGAVAIARRVREALTLASLLRVPQGVALPSGGEPST